LISEAIIDATVKYRASSQDLVDEVWVDVWEPPPEERYLKKMISIIRSHTHQERINALFFRIKARLLQWERFLQTRCG
jgi:hypothetical protein